MPVTGRCQVLGFAITKKKVRPRSWSRAPTSLCLATARCQAVGALEIENKKLQDEVHQLQLALQALQAKQVDDAAQATFIIGAQYGHPYLFDKTGIAGNGFHLGPHDFLWSTSDSTCCEVLDWVVVQRIPLDMVSGFSPAS